jgi:hypothetical protein
MKMNAILSLVPNAKVVIRGDVVEWIVQPPVIPTDAEIVAEMERLGQLQVSKDLESAVDQHIESVAHADRWDSRVTCTIRAGYPNPWQNKAITFGQWMDACYAHCIQVQADVAAGTRPIPTGAELIAELPVMVWPV